MRKTGNAMELSARGLAAGIWGLLAANVAALGPHEIVIVANSNSPSSLVIAREYAVLRQVPGPNIVSVGLPAGRCDPTAVLTPDEFESFIWTPVTNILATRGIDRHVLAWVYSLDFPVRVRIGNQEMSLTGLTFLRNHPPTETQIRDGSMSSPLFAGPEKPWARGFGSQTFEEQRQWLGDDMPLPAMMLGVTNSFANTIDEVRSCLRRGAASDGTRPFGMVYYITNTDVRTRVREWQFRAAVEELERRGIPAAITNDLPSGGGAAIGIMHGMGAFNPARSNLYPAGFIGEHLTSNGAIFSGHEQTRLSAWIGAGATASSGTVAEPYAMWMKFPNARLFVHYTAGCTIIESFYQSIRAPLQILPVGDPLASPWQPKATVVIMGLEGDLPAADTREVTAAVRTRESGLFFTRYLFLLDGRQQGEPVIYPELTLKFDGLTSGVHTLRCVASTPGPIRFQAFGEIAFTKP